MKVFNTHTLQVKEARYIQASETGHTGSRKGEHFLFYIF